MTIRQTIVALQVIFILTLAVPRAASAEENGEAEHSGKRGVVELTCVDDQVIGYATFQSHNQKVVSNQHGIFITYLRTRNEPYTAQTWRLARSQDGGRTFSTVYEAIHATNPPVVETDDAGNVYLIHPDFVDGNAYFYRFLAEKQFREPIVTTISGGAAGKYAMFLDEKLKQAFYFAHNNSFHVIGLDGTVRNQLQLIKAGTRAVLQYPHLSMESGGALHAAWTTQKHEEYLYWDIHHMVSADGGETWGNLDGEVLLPPVVADDSGRAQRITLDDEFECHTWLSSFLVKEGKVHFVYLAQRKPPRQHYMRFDIATGKRDVHQQPEVRGETVRLQGLDGFFSTSSERNGSPLYLLMQDAGHIACLISEDNGETWHDYGKSPETFHVYSLGGCREISEDGYILGTFTDQQGSNATSDRESKVYFFKIRVADERG